MRIPEAEQKKLFGKSGNRCAYPDCRKLLVAAAMGGAQVVVLGEAAHIVGESGNGPRGAHSMSASDRNRYENLILLCSRHHQMVDAEPAKYTIEVLHRYKEEHEQWVEKRMGPTDREMQPAPLMQDLLHSSLLPVERVPHSIFIAPCALSPPEVNSVLRPLRGAEMAPFVQRGGMLIAFQDLSLLDNPFAVAANPLEAQRVNPRSWWDDPDKSRWYVDLLNRTLNKLTGRRHLHWDKDHQRFYFAQLSQGEEREVAYRPLNKKSTMRRVVWQPKKRMTGEARPYWFHRAVNLRFIRSSSANWVLALRPELRVTADGQASLEARRIGARVTRKKSRWFNYDLLAEIQFWRDYLGESRPRIILDFGSAPQQMLLSMNLLSCSVEWPGIPEEFIRAFRNVEYVDDLFTWAEAHPEDYQDVADMEDVEEEELDEDF